MHKFFKVKFVTIDLKFIPLQLKNLFPHKKKMLRLQGS